MRSDLKEFTIRKFKGINASRNSAVKQESFGPAEDQLVDLVNFNTTKDGYLEKRCGTQQLCAIVNPALGLGGYTRIIGIQRGTFGPASGTLNVLTYNYILVTDDVNLWRVNVQTGDYQQIMIGRGGGTVAKAQWSAEYGGTTAASAYTSTIVRQGTGLTAAMGGFLSLGIWNNIIESPGWIPNTPIGTHITIFKDRAFVINSNGSTEAAGNESKVWYSGIGNLADFGGAAMRNFNLDFGDGDYLVATIPFNDQLYCFKTRKTFVVSPEGQPGDWQYKLITDRLGCVGRGTIKVIDGKLYFLSLEGVVRFDGAQAEMISENVKDLLEQYRDFKDPSAAMNTYASHWQNKYILWMPRDTGEGFAYDGALVYDIASSTWSRWTLSNNVQGFSEARFSDLGVDSLFLGANFTAGTKKNRIWRMSNQSWSDDGVAFVSSFRTKKLDFGSPMSQKRMFAVGVTVKNEPTDTTDASANIYQVDNTIDDLFAYSTGFRQPAKFGVANLLCRPPKSPFRYCTTSFTLMRSTAYSAVYDITWLAEDRGIEPYSRPLGSKVEQIPATNIAKAGPDTNCKLTSGYLLR